MGESGENTDIWVDGWRKLNERNNFGWCFWPYKKMDATSNIVSMKRTAEWDSIIVYTKRAGNSFADIRKFMPARDVITKAFDDYLENCKFQHCEVNEGYVKALGLMQNKK